jgi:hypothetical protein
VDDNLKVSVAMITFNHERFIAKMQREPFTDEDARALSDLGL